MVRAWIGRRGNTGSHQDVAEARAPPAAVHDGAVVPVDALDLLEQGAHRVAAVAGALQRAGDVVLREVISQLRDGEVEVAFVDGSVDEDGVGFGAEVVGDRTVVAVVAAFGGEEAVDFWGRLVISCFFFFF